MEFQFFSLYAWQVLRRIGCRVSASRRINVTEFGNWQRNTFKPLQVVQKLRSGCCQPMHTAPAVW